TVRDADPNGMQSEARAPCVSSSPSIPSQGASVAPITDIRMSRGHCSLFSLGRKGVESVFLRQADRYLKYMISSMAAPPSANRDTLKEMGAISFSAISASIKLAPQIKVNSTKIP